MFGIRRLVHPVATGTTSRLIHLSYDKMSFGLMMFLQGQPASSGKPLGRGGGDRPSKPAADVCSWGVSRKSAAVIASASAAEAPPVWPNPCSRIGAQPRWCMTCRWAAHLASVIWCACLLAELVPLHCRSPGAWLPGDLPLLLMGWHKAAAKMACPALTLARRPPLAAARVAQMPWVPR